MFREEAGSTMDETNLNAKPRRTRVLRATDVMPPFDKNSEGPAGENSAQVERQEHAAAEPDDCGSDVTGVLAVAVNAARDTPEDAQSPAGVVEIPSYDLAANILAEQRRVASRRRRAPTQADDAPGTAPAAPATRVSVVEFPAQNLVELQQTVAEIVARDIERLCRPNRPLSA
jgi:hypothetical protein